MLCITPFARRVLVFIVNCENIPLFYVIIHFFFSLLKMSLPKKRLQGTISFIKELKETQDSVNKQVAEEISNLKSQLMTLANNLATIVNHNQKRFEDIELFLKAHLVNRKIEQQVPAPPIVEPTVLTVDNTQ